MSDYEGWFSLFGGEWFLPIALAGVLIAVVAALFVKPQARPLRVPTIVFGSLAGLVLPVMFYVEFGNDVSVQSYINTWGWGLTAYAGACVAAAIVAVVLHTKARK